MKLSKTFWVRVDETEREVIERIANIAGVDFSKVIRSMIREAARARDLELIFPELRWSADGMVLPQNRNEWESVVKLIDHRLSTELDTEKREKLARYRAEYMEYEYYFKGDKI